MSRWIGRVQIAAALPSLDSAALARRLRELVGDERVVQVEFLLHLDEFDRRREYLHAGFPSLWEYCLRALHLPEGPAGRRIAAMRALRSFPELEPALRDGRLCLSTAPLLAQVLTRENVAELIERAAYRTKAEVEQLVISIRPREAPAEGIRKLPAPAAAASGEARWVGPAPEAPLVATGPVFAPILALAAPVAAPPVVEASRPRPAEVRPVSDDHWSVRVTFDAAAKEELDTLKALVSHKIPDGDLNAVLREAIRCGIEKHGNRKGASAPAQQRRSRIDASDDRIPAAVRREVWKRDGGRCTWKGEDGRHCGSRWQLEVDHIHPPRLGGTSKLENLRLLCRPHNMLHAEQTYGREHMDQFRRLDLTVAGDGFLGRG